MPRSKAQNEQIRTERRQAIVKAAIALFAQNGFSQTNMSAVARAAGMSHGTVFLYFPTKEALFEAALREPLAAFQALTLQAMQVEGSPYSRIRNLITRQVLEIGSHEHFLRLTQYVLTHRERFPDLAESLYGFNHALSAGLIPIIQAGQAAAELGPGNPQYIAWSYFAWLNGIGLVFLAPPGDPIWAMAIEYGMRLFSPANGQEG